MTEPSTGDATGSPADDARRAALRRELRDQAIVHSLLYLGMVLLPAIALIWARNQAERWVGIVLAAAVMGLMVTPIAVRWRLLVGGALFAAAAVVRVVIAG